MPTLKKPTKRRSRDMIAEIAELRAVLGMERRQSLETWEQVGDQEMRDKFAVRAFIAENGNYSTALLRLGFTLPKDADECGALVRLIFRTPGVEALLKATLKPVDENKEAIIARMIEVSLYGSADQAVRATQVLSRIAKWEEAPKFVVDNRRINLYQLLHGDATPDALPAGQGELPNGTVDAVEFLSHEPGAPVRISSDDRMDDIIEQEEEPQ